MTDKDRVLRAFAFCTGLEPDRFRDGAALASLGLDSLDAVEFAMTLEEEFGIELPHNAVPLESTIDDIVRLVTR